MPFLQKSMVEIRESSFSSKVAGREGGREGKAREGKDIPCSQGIAP